ncbi:MAG: Vitamin B12 dependent methionine synthase activation subunit [Ruminococcaceae bacterium]|nr:Vitamin B12 dependent methionine synthase activation subunit [Oscillospiraceae bacterium]
MNTGVVYVKKYHGVEIERREIKRYMCAGGAGEDIDCIIDECLKETEKSGVFNYTVCYRLYNCTAREKICNFGFSEIASSDLSKNLSNCEKALVFAATCGIGIDRLVSKYNRISPVKALCMQAIGTEHAEKLCDKFEDDIKKELAENGYITKPRFSPGYGDLPIELQTDIFRELQCTAKAGITLNENLLMTPTKSVTAIIGIKKEEI